MAKLPAVIVKPWKQRMNEFLSVVALQQQLKDKDRQIANLEEKCEALAEALMKVTSGSMDLKQLDPKDFL